MALTEYENFLSELWSEAGSVGKDISPLEWDKILVWANQFYTETYIEFVELPKADEEDKQEYAAIPVTQCTLHDSELRLIRKLSQEYCSEYHEATADSIRPCPTEIVLEDIPEDVAIANADAIEDAFKMFRKESAS